MKKLAASGVLSLLFAIAALRGSTLSGSQDRDINEGMRDRFIGAWRLVSLEEEGEEDKVLLLKQAAAPAKGVTP